MNLEVIGSNIFLVFYYKDFPINQQTNLFVWFPRFFFPIKNLFFFFFFVPPKKILRVFPFDTDEKHFLFFVFNIVFILFYF